MIYAHLVELGLDAPIKLTDYHRDYTLLGVVYSAGSVKINGSVKQKVDLAASDFTIEIDATTDDAFINVFSSNDYKNKPCVITRIEFDETGELLTSRIIFDGLMDSYTFVNDVKGSTIKLKLTSIFAIFNKPHRLNLNQIYTDSITRKDKNRWGRSG